MKVFAISDLHLSFANPKPMDKFGEEWKNHYEKVEKCWREVVTDSDIVLIPGDLSWALRYKDAVPDLKFVANLPGEKVVIKGNHDYWWLRIKQLRIAAPSSVHYIRHDVKEFGNVAVSETRLWSFPFIRWQEVSKRSDVDGGENNGRPSNRRQMNHEKIRNREMIRLNLCLSKISNSSCQLKVILIHFPPIGPDFLSNSITKLISQHYINTVVFGHLHYLPKSMKMDTKIDGVRYVYVSCEYLNFKPKLIFEV